MPSIVVGSVNINTFSFSVSFDIYNRTIIFDTSSSIYNGSSGSGVFAVQGIGFSVVDQQGVSLIDVDFSQVIPSVNPVYVLDVSYVNFAFLFQNYKIYGSIKDANGTVYSTSPVYKTVCQPVGLNEDGSVDGMFQITPDCNSNVLSVSEVTLLVYNNEMPISVIKNGTLYYPTGTISPIVFTGTPFANNVVYTGQYRIVNTTAATYDLGDQVYVIVSYVIGGTQDAVFDIQCGSKMANLICCIEGIQQTAIKNCNNAIGANAQQQLLEISTYFLSGVLAEMSGQDSSLQYNYIKKQLNCNCGATSIRQNEPVPINPSVYSILVVGTNGTTVTQSQSGSTKTFTVSSNIFQVVKADTGDLAFTITTDTSTANVVKYKIAFNYAVMAGYILTAIANSPNTLVPQLNSLIFATTQIDLTSLDGKCIIDLTAISYFLSFLAPNANQTVTSILIGSTTYTAPGGLFISNTAGVESWLNGLGLGAFESSFSVAAHGVYFNALTNNNTNSPVSMVLTVNGSPTTILFQKTNKSLIAFLQAVVDYLCGLSALQVALGNNLSLCFIDYNGNETSINYTTSNTQNEFNLGISNAICSLVARIQTLTVITCDKLKAVFIDRPSSNFLSTDRFYGTLSGNCSGISNSQAALAIINAINSDSVVKEAFCAIDCTVPAVCPDISNTAIAITGNNIGVYGLTWATTPIATQTVTVRYKVSSSSVWIIANNALQVLPNGNLSGSTPYSITGLAANTTYDVWIVNNCGGFGFVKQVTTPSGAAIAGDYLRDNVLYNICADSPVTLYTAIDFGIGVVVYTDAGLTTPLTGYTLIAPLGGAIYNISSTTGIVGSVTGVSCGSGTYALYKLGTDTSTICAATVQPLFTNGVFAVGKTLYFDSSLSSPVTGYTYVVGTNNHIYILNPSTGVIGADTTLACSTDTVIIFNNMNSVQLTNVSGLTGFTPSPALPLLTGQHTTGVHNAGTASIIFTISGTPIQPSSFSQFVNGILVQCLNNITTSGIHAFNAFNYLATDVISIQMNDFLCS